ncbi:MAG: beta-lactamase family protein [Robiginitomaculum sp.]|nr:beta-lactamase family protein [Robiginitomaculum sp.]
MTGITSSFRMVGLLAVLGLAACAANTLNPSATIAPTAGPVITPAQTARTTRLDAVLAELVAENSVPGISLLLYENGVETYFNAVGDVDRENAKPMTRKAVARYYSMTKPIIGVAMMKLYEEGKFAFDDPIEKYLPEYANLKVYAGKDDDEKVLLDDLQRPVTILDLMRHTAGFAYGLLGQTPVDALYRSAGLLRPDKTNAEFSAKLASFPLLHQPGEKWVYSVATDVQGRLIEVLSGQSLGEYLAETIFMPLDMPHTAFSVKPEHLELFSPAYRLTRNGVVRMTDNVFFQVDAPFLGGSAFEGGGGGLVSTVDDYTKFTQMLVNGGAMGDVRIISEASMALMTQNHLGDIPSDRFGPDTGFGFNFAVKIGQAPDTGLRLPIGSYHWGGAGGTFFWVDPQNNLTLVYQIQVLGSGAAKVRQRIANAVYGGAKTDAMTATRSDSDKNNSTP